MHFASIYYMVHCLLFLLQCILGFLLFKLAEICFNIPMFIYYGSEFGFELILSFIMLSMLGKKDFVVAPFAFVCVSVCHF